MFFPVFILQTTLPFFAHPRGSGSLRCLSCRRSSPNTSVTSSEVQPARRSKSEHRSAFSRSASRIAYPPIITVAIPWSNDPIAPATSTIFVDLRRWSQDYDAKSVGGGRGRGALFAAENWRQRIGAGNGEGEENWWQKKSVRSMSQQVMRDSSTRKTGLLASGGRTGR